MKSWGLVSAILFLAACSDSGRAVNIPVVAAGEYETQCQDLCSLAPGEMYCTQKHSDFCLARCRVRTNGLPTACATCLFAKGERIKGFLDFSNDPACTTNGPGDITECKTECDDGGSAPGTTLAALCQLECAFYMQDAEPLACSSDSASACLAKCMTATARGRLCGTCLADQTVPTRFCFNDDCDCEPQFQSEDSACDPVCNTTVP